MEDRDLTGLLRSWKYDQHSNMRQITTSDGRAVIQVRLPLGIEQYEMDGRPDGQRPQNHETYLGYLEERLRLHIVTNGSDRGFVVTSRDVAELQSEGILFYYRYVLLYQLERFDLVIRDTEHNLSLCDVLERYCPNEEERDSVLQYQPFIIRMNAAARVKAIEKGQRSGDVGTILGEAIARVQGLELIDTPVFQLEQHRSVQHLQEMIPVTLDDGLEDALSRAVQEEDYERAAVLRDRLQARNSHVDKER